MDEPGISITEACAKRAEQGSGYLTDEDFANRCNADGTVRQTNASTTFTVKNSNSSLTVDNSLLLIGAVVLIVAMILVVGLLVRKNRKTS